MIITAKELAEKLQAKLVGNGALELVNVAKIEQARSNEVSFIANPAYRKHLGITSAGAIIINEVPAEAEKEFTYLVTDDPYGAFLKTLILFHPLENPYKPSIHPSATIAEGAYIGEDVFIGPNCVIEEDAEIGKGSVLRANVFVGRGATIGENCFFHNGVSIREKCILGNRVIIQDGAIVGTDGFGFAPQEQEYLKIPQVGIVIIEDDVEIGAGTTIDRATLGETRICKGVKLDNLIQVAHNVVIGENTVIAAQAGIAGSASIGKWSMLGGQVGISGHISLSDGVKVAASSGVHSDPGENEIVGGYPARKIQHWRRIEASLSNLPELFKRVRALERMKKE